MRSLSLFFNFLGFVLSFRTIGMVVVFSLGVFLAHLWYTFDEVEPGVDLPVESMSWRTQDGEGVNPLHLDEGVWPLPEGLPTQMVEPVRVEESGPNEF
jgi:hypothetical protein